MISPGTVPTNITANTNQLSLKQSLICDAPPNVLKVKGLQTYHQRHRPIKPLQRQSPPCEPPMQSLLLPLYVAVKSFLPRFQIPQILAFAFVCSNINLPSLKKFRRYALFPLWAVTFFSPGLQTPQILPFAFVCSYILFTWTSYSAATPFSLCVQLHPFYPTSISADTSFYKGTSSCHGSSLYHI